MNDDSQTKSMNEGERASGENQPESVLNAEQLADLDHDLEVEEARRFLYLSPAQKRRMAIEAKQAELAALKLENQRKGWTAQVYDDTDAWRAGEGKDTNNTGRRADYANVILETEGRPVRPYQKATPERRKRQNTDAQAKRRENMTPEQREEVKRKDRERKQAKADAARAAVEAKLKDGAIF